MNLQNNAPQNDQKYNTKPLVEMLACVCQPADPNIFRRSPIPLVTTPIKINSKGAIPKLVPGKSIRITDSLLTASTTANFGQDKNDSNEETSVSMNVLLAEPNREALLSFGGEKNTKEINHLPSKDFPVVRKCTKKNHSRHKLRKSGKYDKKDIIESNCDKENVSLSSENVVTCDKKSKKEKSEEYPRVSKLVKIYFIPEVFKL